MRAPRAMPDSGSDKDLVEDAGAEVKSNPPKILAKTYRKSGAKMANKQRVAIILSKARGKGARI